MIIFAIILYLVGLGICVSNIMANGAPLIFIGFIWGIVTILWALGGGMLLAIVFDEEREGE